MLHRDAHASRNASFVIRPWARDALAGCVAAVVTLAGWLTLALLPYAALGPAAAEVGMPAAVAAVVVGGLVVCALGRSAMPTGGLSSATTLMFAAAVTTIASDPALRLDDRASIVALVAVASSCVVGMGALQVIFGLLRLGNVAKYVPQPVLAGFMNSVAVLVVVAQLPLLLGMPGTTLEGGLAAAVAQLQPATLAIGIATATIVWVVAARWPNAPATLIGLAAGCALYAAIRVAAPGVALGPLVGTVPNALPLPDALAPLFGSSLASELFSRHAETLVGSALALAIVGSLETVLNALGTDRQRHTRHDPNRELIAFGAANVASGLFGGLPVVYWRSRVAAIVSAGSRSRVGIAAAAVATAVLFVVGGPLIELLPLTVLAGLMLTVAWSLVDRWSRQMLSGAAAGNRSRDVWLNLALVAVVFGVTLWRGFVAGVALGVLLAMALFIHAMNRSLLRGRFTGAERPSRRVYPRAQEDVLHAERAHIVVLELEGALFFGNAESLAREFERIDRDARYVVLDLKRVSMLDPSAAIVLEQLDVRLAAAGRMLLLAGVSADNRHGRALVSFGSVARDRWFADADRAVERAERDLLERAGLALGASETSIADCTIARGLDAAQLARLQALLQTRRLEAQELLFRQGDPGDCLYVLTEGSITIASPGDREHRYITFSPGMMLGETAMLDGRGRTADAIADVPSVVHALTREALEQLAREDPVLAQQITANVALHLSERLREAAAAWRLAAA